MTKSLIVFLFLYFCLLWWLGYEVYRGNKESSVQISRSLHNIDDTLNRITKQVNRLDQLATQVKELEKEKIMVRSVKGKEINMLELSKQHSKSIALGNARMNANGDVLSKGGKIVKTRNDIAKEYHQKSSNKVKTVPLSDEISEMLGGKKADQVQYDLKKNKKKKED